MELEKRTKILIGVASVFVIVAVVLIIVGARKNKTDAAPTDQSVDEKVVMNESLGEPTDAPIVEKAVPTAQGTTKNGKILAQDTQEAQLRRIAMDFVARFGTYSSDGNSENLKQLLPAMTPSLRAWAQARIAEKPVAPTQFQGVTTRALSAKVLSQAGIDASVQVSTQRQTTTGSETAVTYVKAMVSAVKSDGTWIVDSVSWVK